MKRVEVISFKGCEPTAELLNELDELIEREGLDVEVELAVVPSPKRAAEMGLYGSPTIRIDGAEYQRERRGPPGFF